MNFYISISDGAVVWQLNIAGEVVDFPSRAEAEAEADRLRAGVGIISCPAGTQYAVVGEDENDPLLTALLDAAVRS